MTALKNPLELGLVGIFARKERIPSLVINALNEVDLCGSWRGDDPRDL